MDSFKRLLFYCASVPELGLSEVEFITIMGFESWDAVKQFAGEDYEKAYVPPKARKVLSRFDDRSQHYEIRERITY